jgi:HK97 family phage major capsid protein
MQDYINKLVEQRNRAWHEARTVLADANEAGRELDGEERGKVDACFADMDRLDVEIKDLTARNERMLEADVAREAYADLVKPVAEAPRSTVDPVEAFFRGQGGRGIDIDLSRAANEKSLIRGGADARELRALTVGSAAAAGTTVPTTFERTLYEYLENVSGVRQVANVITTAGGEPIDFPRVTSFGTAAAVAEGSVLAENDANFSLMQLGAFKFGQLLKISSELLADSGVDIVSFAARDLGRALGRVTGNAYTNGAGGAGAPQGIMGAAGTATPIGGTGTAGVPTVEELIALAYSLGDEGYRQNAVWLMRDSTAGAIRTVTDQQGQFLWQPSVVAGTPDRLLGFPVVIDPFVAATGTNVNSVAFGDFSAFYIRDAGPIRIERSDDAFFANDIVAWRAVMRTDSDLIDSRAVKLYRGGTA